MTELKTLKDCVFLKECIHFPKARINCSEVAKKALKQEAIKWIKDIEWIIENEPLPEKVKFCVKHLQEDTWTVLSLKEIDAVLFGVAQGLQMFFNIKEEDLNG